MAAKDIVQRKAKKFTQMQKLKDDIAKLEGQAAERLGRLAVKAGLGELVLEDDQLFKEFAAMVARFRNGQKPPEQVQGPSA